MQRIVVPIGVWNLGYLATAVALPAYAATAVAAALGFGAGHGPLNHAVRVTPD
jgi:hypothetical protein